MSRYFASVFVSTNATFCQIPEFDGSQDENVAVWIRRVDRVTEIHATTDGITLLAASSKLIKTTKTWYDSLESDAIESWRVLKVEMLDV